MHTVLPSKRAVRHKRVALLKALAPLAVSLGMLTGASSATAASSAIGTITLNLTLIDLDLSDGVTSAISFSPKGSGILTDANGNYVIGADGQAIGYSFASKVNVSILQDGTKVAGQRDYSSTVFDPLAASADSGVGDAGTATSIESSPTSLIFSLFAKSMTPGVTVASVYSLLSQFELTAHTAVVVKASLIGGVAGDAEIFGGGGFDYDGAPVLGSGFDLILSTDTRTLNSTGGTQRVDNTSNTALSGTFNVVVAATADTPVASVPEPQSAGLLLAGLVVLAGRQARRRQA